jgi:hypothetical protein
VGTSMAWPGPAWRGARRAARRGGRTGPSAGRPDQIPVRRDGSRELFFEDQLADWGRLWLEQLHRDLERDPEAFGLRRVATKQGRELVRAVRELGRRPVDDLSEAGRAQVVADFTMSVAESGGGVVDAVVRRAAARAAARLLDRHGIEAFCLVYREFFADLVAGFLQAVIAEQVRLAVPGIDIVDPTGRVVEWIAAHLVAMVPDPCAEAAARPGASVLDVAEELVPCAVDTVLGIAEPPA